MYTLDPFDRLVLYIVFDKMSTFLLSIKQKWIQRRQAQWLPGRAAAVAGAVRQAGGREETQSGGF